MLGRAGAVTKNCSKIRRGGDGMKQEREAYLLNCGGMPERAGTATKLQENCSGRCRKEARKGSILIKLLRNVGTGPQSCSTIGRGDARMKQGMEAYLENCGGMPGRAGTVKKLQ